MAAADCSYLRRVLGNWLLVFQTMIHLSTIQLLREWARWGQMQNIDYPTMSPMFGERALKTPLFGVGHLPADVARVEKAVCALNFFDRNIIILRYQRRLTFGQMGKRLECSRWTAKRMLRTAENETHHILSDGYCQRAPTSVHSGADSKPVTP